MEGDGEGMDRRIVQGKREIEMERSVETGIAIYTAFQSQG